ncbi:MAG: hydroxymethylglutaryl-CoA reductase, degradative, partial [Thermoplasmata archaeon]
MTDESRYTSNLAGFYKLTTDERRRMVASMCRLSSEEVKLLEDDAKLGVAGPKMVENYIGIMPVPLGVATNFLIDNMERLVPMATEEPSVIAAASHGAKIVRAGGGFFTEVDEPVMIGQIQIPECNEPEMVKERLLHNKEVIIKKANSFDPVLVKLGGGCRDIEVRIVDISGSCEKKSMVVVHLLVDVRDAMGANAVNTMAEGVSRLIEEIAGCSVHLRILSNLAVKRIARARCLIPFEALGDNGRVVANGIEDAWRFAYCDIFRAATHNKGIMNGISAVALATGNDTRAL